MADTTKLEITLIRAPGDPSLRSRTFQKKLRHFAESISVKGFQVSVQMEEMSAAGGGGDTVYMGRFAVELVRSPVTGVVVTAIGAWLTARLGHKVRLKIGDIEAEARTVIGSRKTSLPRPGVSATQRIQGHYP